MRREGPGERSYLGPAAELPTELLPDIAMIDFADKPDQADA